MALNNEGYDGKTNLARNIPQGEQDYIPYGEEWEAYLMKLPKKFIIDLYRKKCLKYEHLKSTGNELID